MMTTRLLARAFDCNDSFFCIEEGKGGRAVEKYCTVDDECKGEALLNLSHCLETNVEAGPIKIKDK